jgi:hypothetical protein
VSKARIEGETTVDQGDGRIDVLAEIPEHDRYSSEDLRVVGGALKCPSSKIDTLPAVPYVVIYPCMCVERKTALGR